MRNAKDGAFMRSITLFYAPFMGSGGKATNPGQLLHVDIVFIAGKPRLFSVDDITRYIVMARIESKGQADVNKAIDAIVSRYQSSLKVVSVISCDQKLY